MNVHERFKDYDKEHCWQYEIRQQNFLLDLEESGMSEKDAQGLCIADFDFAYIPKEDKDGCQEIKEFIERHEWLGKMPIWATHRFTARLKRNGILAGVIVMATPNTFSNLLGRENKDKEKLIARGASISWAPKNMGSWLIMSAVRWMVANTEFRFFTAYSDPEAKELGTIYQACNFIYLGQKFGTGKQFLDPDNPRRGWFGSAGFSDRSQIVRYAKKLGIEWQPEWYKMVGSKKNYRKVDWKAIPEPVAAQLKGEREAHKARCQQRPSPSKHKYVYILGKTKKETKFYKKLFEQYNPEKVELPYPVLRGQ
tara:strand:+ start:1706 stop:2635 length:930 start_codon:yes stop_codon:yes gene_type:complete